MKHAIGLDELLILNLWWNTNERQGKCFLILFIGTRSYEVRAVEFMV
jgi:hypothetical protein